MTDIFAIGPKELKSESKCCVDSMPHICQFTQMYLLWLLETYIVLKGRCRLC